MVPYSVRLEEKNVEFLKKFCEATGRNRNYAINLAIKRFEQSEIFEYDLSDSEFIDYFYPDLENGKFNPDDWLTKEQIRKELGLDTHLFKKIPKEFDEAEFTKENKECNFVKN